MFKNLNTFYIWWVSELFIGAGLFWSWYFGLVSKIWTIDITMITSIILLIFVSTNIMLGYVAYSLDQPTPLDKSARNQVKSKLTRLSENCWFLSEQMMALGMLGTVIGLIHMLTVNFISSGGTDIDAAQAVINNMWGAMGLALYTNAVGLAASIITKVQVYFITGNTNNEA